MPTFGNRHAHTPEDALDVLEAERIDRFNARCMTVNFPRGLPDERTIMDLVFSFHFCAFF